MFVGMDAIYWAVTEISSVEANQKYVHKFTYSLLKDRKKVRNQCAAIKNHIRVGSLIQWA
jgi:hypothetical protein